LEPTASERVARLSGQCKPSHIEALLIFGEPTHPQQEHVMKPVILWFAGVPIVGIVLLKVFGII
jgi:hypothetical protein